MTQAVLVELEWPKDWRRFRLPPALNRRLQDLLDEQDRTGRLSSKDRAEAKALADLVDALAVMRLRAKVAAGKRRP